MTLQAGAGLAELLASGEQLQERTSDPAAAEAGPRQGRTFVLALVELAEEEVHQGQTSVLVAAEEEALQERTSDLAAVEEEELQGRTSVLAPAVPVAEQEEVEEEVASP